MRSGAEAERRSQRPSNSRHRVRPPLRVTGTPAANRSPPPTGDRLSKAAVSDRGTRVLLPPHGGASRRPASADALPEIASTRLAGGSRWTMRDSVAQTLGSSRCGSPPLTGLPAEVVHSRALGCRARRPRVRGDPVKRHQERDFDASRGSHPRAAARRLRLSLSLLDRRRGEARFGDARPAELTRLLRRTQSSPV